MLIVQTRVRIWVIIWLALKLHLVLSQNATANDSKLESNVASRISRHFCMPMLRLFSLELRQALEPNEFVGLTGDHTKLGAWQLNKSVELYTHNATGLNWYRRMVLCARERVSYRYFIFKKDSQTEKRILQWEGQMHPRFMQYYEMYRKPGIDVFGDMQEQGAVSLIELEAGWLRHEYVIELQFIWQQQILLDARSLWESYHLKLFILNDENSSDIDIAVGRYSYRNSQLRAQPESGIRYVNGDIVIFRITLPLSTIKSYQLHIYGHNGHLLGVADILASELNGSGGVLQIPIYDYETGLDIGALTLPFLVIEPLDSAANIDFMSSFQHYWPANWPTIEVGNRGMGASFYKSKAKFIENTLASFLAAEKLHADMLHLNIILTKDYVPIVWPDFGFYTAPRTHTVNSDLDIQFRLIKDLTYNELKAKRVFVYKQNFLHEYTHLNTHDSSNAERLFLTLAEVFANLPNTLGLILDVKWPQQLDSGMFESDQTLDKNRYVDTLLQLTATDGCGRPIIFASFDADICTLIRLKQHSFPVVLRTYAKIPAFESYRDLRTHTFMAAVNFAASADILGTAPHAQQFLQQPDNLNLGLDLNQVVFLWGDMLNNNDVLYKLRSVQVTGLIYNRIDKLLPSTKRSSFFKAPELLEIFAKQCFISPNMSTTTTTTRTAVSPATSTAARYSFWSNLKL